MPASPSMVKAQYGQRVGNGVLTLALQDGQGVACIIFTLFDSEL